MDAYTAYAQFKGFVKTVEGQRVSAELRYRHDTVLKQLPTSVFGTVPVAGNRFFFHDFGGKRPDWVVVTHFCGREPIGYDRSQVRGIPFNGLSILETVVQGVIEEAAHVQLHPSNGVGDTWIALPMEEFRERTHLAPGRLVRLQRREDKWYLVRHVCPIPVLL